MTIYELKRQYQSKQGGYFFDRDTMRYWGDTMKGFTAPRRVLVMTTRDEHVECWEVRRKEQRTDNACPWFFACDDFRRVYGWEVVA